MEAEASSSFETSEMLGSFLASTPLISDSWRICSRANTAAPGSFVTAQIGAVGYVAFSGVQTALGPDVSLRNLVALDAAAEGLFTPLRSHGTAADGDEPPVVQAGMLHIFMNIYRSPQFQDQILGIMQNCSSIIITGHSVGGSIASLSALWLLSYLQSISSPLQILCITFGSPFLGNASLSRAILRERWGGNFVHVIANHDIVPRLLLAPLPSPSTQAHYFLLQFWHLLMTSLHFGNNTVVQLPENEIGELFRFVVAHAEAVAKGDGPKNGLFWPFGNYFYCGEEGAICLDNGAAIVRMMYLTMAGGTVASCIEDHLKYGEYVGKISHQFFKRRSCDTEKDSCYEVGLEVALQSLGITTQDLDAKNCLKMAKRLGRTPYLNSAYLAIELSKIAPYRAQIEWYKASCDESDDQLGYYDSFKQRGASKKHFKVYMNCIKLGNFWDDLIHKLDTEQLPHDFPKRAKWVNASQSYKLLVEPLDIAEYYRSGAHRIKGHYLKHGRERRFEIFDKWWKEREVGEEEHNLYRTKLASLTQDSCFWAKVEEARELLETARTESDTRKLAVLWERIDEFELYARSLVECKEVSRDVLAKNSSYSEWVEEWTELKSQMMQVPSQFSGFLNGGMVP